VQKLLMKNMFFGEAKEVFLMVVCYGDGYSEGMDGSFFARSNISLSQLVFNPMVMRYGNSLCCISFQNI